MRTAGRAAPPPATGKARGSARARRERPAAGTKPTRVPRRGEANSETNRGISPIVTINSVQYATIQRGTQLPGTATAPTAPSSLPVRDAGRPRCAARCPELDGREGPARPARPFGCGSASRQRVNREQSWHGAPREPRELQRTDFHGLHNADAASHTDL